MAKKTAKKKTGDQTSKSFMDGSPWVQVNQEVYQGWHLRRDLIAKVEKRLRGKVIMYFTSFYDENAMITDKDAEMLENMLSTEHDGGRIFLILNSAGGLGLAAERIVNVCRAYSNDNFEVIVPHMAKSAATLICFGAARIHMSQTSELGPVDPQIKYQTDAGDKEWISAQEYVRSYDKLMEEATSGRAKRLEPIMQQLVRYDARYIEQLKSAQSLSQKISIKLLVSGMMSRRSEAFIEEAISAFLVQEESMSHGRMIGMAEAKQCGLRVKEIPLRSQLWNWIWELYIRADYVVSARCSKILESSVSALSA